MKKEIRLPKEVYKKIGFKEAKEEEPKEAETKFIVEKHQISIKMPKRIRIEIEDIIKKGQKAKITLEKKNPLILKIEAIK